MILSLTHRLGQALLCLFLSLATAQACGPDFSPDIFVRPNRPDIAEQFAAGKLGILQPTFPRADLMVAYRYLSGGTLDAAEQKSWSPTLSMAEQDAAYIANPSANEDAGKAAPNALARWVAARSHYTDPPAKPPVQNRSISAPMSRGGSYEGDFLNCTDDAFVTATATLSDRARQWGASASLLKDWLHGQDAVFANCAAGDAAPGAAPANSPPLLLSDRAYQAAAASFYAMHFDQAHVAFLAIAEQHGSPWQPLAGYLAARVLVRQAFLSRHDVGDQATYDPSLMKAAEQQLRAYLAVGPAPAMRHAAEAELALVRLRTEPLERARELGQQVAGPAHDPSYAQNVRDLLWLINDKTPDGLRAQSEMDMSLSAEPLPSDALAKMRRETIAQRHDAYAATAPIRAVSPLIDWTLTVQSLAPEAAAHAVAEWQHTRSTPWLTAALLLATDTSPDAAELEAAAAALKPDSPAWKTATYHRVRLLIASGKAEQARSALASALPEIEARRQPSSINAFRGLAMLAAPTFAEFLNYAPRTLLLSSSEEYSSQRECREVMQNPARHYDCAATVEPQQLDADAAAILNHSVALADWLTAAQSTAFSSQLRRAVTFSGWTRAVLLEDGAAAKAFAALLPSGLRNQAGDGVGLPALLTLLRNPGLSPYLDGGTQRSYSYDFVESYRDNWCYRPGPKPIAAAAFLDKQQQTLGAEQAHRLATIDAAALGQRVVDSVDQHPEEPRSAEALYLVLRMIRYGCTPAAETSAPADATPLAYSAREKQLLAIKQRASRILRQRYAKSEWTRKAAPFAG